MNQSAPLIYQFDLFRLDTGKRLLWRETEPVQLAPKAFDTLVCLLQSSGQVVERETLMQTLWPDTFVEDTNLTVNISALRKALGEQSDEHRFIVTVPRRGYCFVAPVTLVTTEAPPATLAEEISEPVLELDEVSLTGQDSQPQSSQPAPTAPQALVSIWTRSLSWKLGVGVLMAVLGMVVLGWMWTQRSTSQSSGAIKSLAVLPFQVLNSNENDYLRIGLADALITKFSRLKQIAVSPTSAILKYEQGPYDLTQVGQDLRVEALLEGKIQQSGNKLRVTVQMIKVSDGMPLWADSFDAELTDVFTVQDAISERVLNAFAIQLSAQDRRQLTHRDTQNPLAFHAYLKGRYFWNLRTGPGLEKAITNFHDAVTLDPTYAMAYAGLADAYNVLSLYSATSPKITFPQAILAARKAIELDQTLAEAHTALAFAKARYEWDWAGAEKEFKYAIELNPNYPTGHHWYGEFLMLMGRMDEAETELRRAQELDPLSIAIHNGLGWGYFYNRRFDQAVVQFNKSLELSPQFSGAYLGLGMAYEQQGLYPQAAEAFEKTGETRRSRGAHMSLAWGKKEKALEVLAMYENAAPHQPEVCYEIGVMHTGLGQYQVALTWLERAIQNHNQQVMYLKIDPRLDPLRSKPEFGALLKQMKLD